VNSEGLAASTLILLGARAMLLSTLKTRKILALLKQSKYLVKQANTSEQMRNCRSTENNWKSW
jgi:hypothetical protein